MMCGQLVISMELHSTFIYKYKICAFSCWCTTSIEPQEHRHALEVPYLERVPPTAINIYTQ